MTLHGNPAFSAMSHHKICEVLDGLYNLWYSLWSVKIKLQCCTWYGLTHSV